MTYDCSAAALKPLFDMFWSSEGWRTSYVAPAPKELARAEAIGIMFGSPDLSDHDEWVNRARQAAARIELGEVTDGFLASFTSRRLDLRSALSSFVLARALPEHRYQANPDGGGCSVCGDYDREETDLNVLSFERFKWGGVRKESVTFAAFDLEQFELAPKLVPTSNDVTMWKKVLRAVEATSGETTASSLAAALGILPGNRAERSTLIGTLGICSVLETSAHRGFLDQWTNDQDREIPDRHFVDDPYPVSWWRKSDGVNVDALSRLNLAVT